MGEIVGNFIFVGRSVVKKFLTTDFYIEYNRDLTNLDLMGRGWGDREGVGGRMFTICSTILGSGVI